MSGYEEGNFIGPTIFSGVTTEMEIYRTEIFGPVLVVLSVPTLDDAIALVNRNPIGNGVGLFTQSGAAARKFQSEIDMGQVGINIPIPVPVPFLQLHGFARFEAGRSRPVWQTGRAVLHADQNGHRPLVRRRRLNDGVNTTISLK